MSKRSLLLKSGAAAIALASFIGLVVMFDSFVRMASTQMLQMTISDVSKGAEVAVFDATNTLDAVLDSHASICTTRFVETVRQTLQRSIYVRQILVENDQGARYCSGLEVDFDYQVMSEEFPIPGRNETLAAIRILGTQTTLLRITHRADDNRTISAFVHYAPILATGQLPGILSWGDLLRVEFTDGTEVLGRGDRAAFDFSSPTDSHIYAIALVGELPLKTLGSVPFDVVREHYWNMYLGMFGVAFALCAGVLFLVIRLIGKDKMAPIDLEFAIESGQIKPFYQPVIDVQSGRVTGCQVLARWVKPNGKIILPAVFIDYAEAAGLAEPLTLSLMQQVAHDLEGAAENNAELEICFNLFREHFRSTHIVDDVTLIFSKSKIGFEQLLFELPTWKMLGKSARNTIKGLKEQGCKLALDDGAASLEHIKRMEVFGVDQLTLGLEFQGKLDNADHLDEVIELIAAVKKADIALVAKGVETKAQAGFMRENGVFELQGYLFSPALPAEKFILMHNQLNGYPPAVGATKKESKISRKQRSAA